MATEAKPTLLARAQGWFAGIGKYLREVRAEFKRVQWPNRKELMSYTIAVVVYVFIVAVFLGVIDLGLSALVNRVFGTAA
ncbi:MAG: preprotein translocase subunit SecE [Clostridia bacterium]|nr:preprotein translocase subunit SecE [Clostridia bacterium]